MEGIQTLKGSWPWPWPWIRLYGIPSCITHRPLPMYQISLKSKKLFVDGRTDVRTDGHFPPLILLGRLLEVDLKSSGTSFRLTLNTVASGRFALQVWYPPLATNSVTVKAPKETHLFCGGGKNQRETQPVKSVVICICFWRHDNHCERAVHRHTQTHNIFTPDHDLLLPTVTWSILTTLWKPT